MRYYQPLPYKSSEHTARIKQAGFTASALSFSMLKFCCIMLSMSY